MREILQQKHFRTGLKNEVKRHDYIPLTKTPSLRQGPSWQSWEETHRARTEQGTAPSRQTRRDEGER